MTHHLAHAAFCPIRQIESNRSAYEFIVSVVPQHATREIKPSMPILTVTVDFMAAKRRPRGTLVDPVQLGYPVERRNKERFAAIARHANISAAALFDLLVENMPLDERGFPLWLHEQLADKDGELPIDSA